MVKSAGRLALGSAGISYRDNNFCYKINIMNITLNIMIYPDYEIIILDPNVLL